MRLREFFLKEAEPAMTSSSGWAGELFGKANQAANKPWELVEPEDTADTSTAGTTDDAAATDSSTAAPSAAGGSGNARVAMQFFISKGLTTAQAAGIVGNLQAESGANLNPSAVGDGGQAIGIAQWHPDRRANFQRAFGKPFSESTFRDQLNFIWWEFQNTERSAFNRLRRTTTATQAAAVIDQYYERSSGAHRRRRMQYAAALAAPTGTATA